MMTMQEFRELKGWYDRAFARWSRMSIQHLKEELATYNRRIARAQQQLGDGEENCAPVVQRAALVERDRGIRVRCLKEERRLLSAILSLRLSGRDLV
ncbi:MAG: hypothetical protein GEU73_16285 [Chloroflexi bacterium]|nr:hypothetical protein [Chloroflexota bacterium]